MRTKLRFPLWILPIIGLIAGYLVADLQRLRSLPVWVKVESPSVAVARIIKDVDRYNLLVESASGETLYVQTDHCWIYDNNGSQRYVGTQPHAGQYSNTKFNPPPLPFPVKQYYSISYYADGPLGLLSYALSGSGELWVWNACDSGWGQFYYFLFTFMGLIGGIFLALAIWATRKFVSLINKKNTSINKVV